MIKQMNKKIFFILEGNSGAGYIFNAKDVASIAESLKFYKALTLKQKAMKNALKLYLNGIGLLCKIFSLCTHLKDKNEIEQYLEKLTELPMDFELDENCSILISPTRDKIIAHHHGAYFHKFAFGKSYEKVRNEAAIYKLLDRAFRHFRVSSLFELEEKEEDAFCSFKLGDRKRRNDKGKIDIVAALVEFFDVTRQEERPLSRYVETLEDKYAQSGLKCQAAKDVLKKLSNMNENALLPLGLVHRDFKPWNINDENGLLIYDFEEAVTEGLPLEDLFNFHIDPIVRYEAPETVMTKAFSNARQKEYERYLSLLGTEIDTAVLFRCYVVERISFWRNENDDETSEKFCSLLKYIEENMPL